MVDKARDELLKDILALANGNSHIIRKNKYIIIGVDDTIFDDTRERIRHSIDYRVPTQSEIAKWLSKACSPALIGLECGLINYKGDCIFLITIPPTFDLHETSRELNASSGIYREHTVFMRHDEHIFTASVHDGITIQQLKHLYRQETTNPPSTLIGAIVGGIVGFMITQARINAVTQNFPVQENLIKMTLIGSSLFIGTSIGIVMKWLNETRYELRYLTWKQRIRIFFMVGISIIVFCYLIR